MSTFIRERKTPAIQWVECAIMSELYICVRLVRVLDDDDLSTYGRSGERKAFEACITLGQSRELSLLGSCQN